jgi:tetratricopeptide (TPR) repeat protein
LMYHLQMDEAVREMRLAQELDPVSPITNSALSHLLMMARDYDGAIKYGESAIEIDPQVPAGHYNLGDAYLQKGVYEKALAEYKLMEVQRPQEAAQFIAYAYAAWGRRAEAEKILSQLLQAPQREEIQPYNLALIYGALRDKDKAFAWLEKVETKSSFVVLFKYDPQLDSLRADPRFAEFLRRRHLTYLQADETAVN